MRSRTPKMLHELCGRPMVLWPVLAALLLIAFAVLYRFGPSLPDRERRRVQS